VTAQQVPDARPLRRVSVDRTLRAHEPDAWYHRVPAIAQLGRDGWEVPAGITFLVGENGSGKSTLAEAVGHAWQGRVGSQAPYWGPEATDDVAGLYRCLRLDALRPIPTGGFFLRAEAMHSYFAAIGEEHLRAFGGTPLHGYSHGESFLAVLRTRANEQGFYVFDEPEAALSFRSCLALLALLDVLRSEGSQAVVATHSPLLPALPDATVLELGEWGWRPSSYDDLDLVRDWRDFLAAPQRYLRHLLD
jgi:predicted ATPase